MPQTFAVSSRSTVTVELRREAPTIVARYLPRISTYVVAIASGHRQRPGAVTRWTDAGGHGDVAHADGPARRWPLPWSPRRSAVPVTAPRRPPTPTSTQAPAPRPRCCATSSTCSHAEAEAAAEDYGAANDRRSSEVVSQLLAGRRGRRRRADRGRRRAAGRTADAARHMYMTGGTGSLYASVLAGQSISDVLDRIASVDSVVRGDIVASDEARLDVAEATADPRRPGRSSPRSKHAPGDRSGLPRRPAPRRCWHGRAWRSTPPTARARPRRARARRRAGARPRPQRAAAATDGRPELDHRARARRPGARGRPRDRRGRGRARPRRTPSARSPTCAAGWARRTPRAAADATAPPPAGARAALPTTAAATTAPAGPRARSASTARASWCGSSARRASACRAPRASSGRSGATSR